MDRIFKHNNKKGGNKGAKAGAGVTQIGLDLTLMSQSVDLDQFAVKAKHQECIRKVQKLEKKLHVIKGDLDQLGEDSKLNKRNLAKKQKLQKNEKDIILNLREAKKNLEEFAPPSAKPKSKPKVQKSRPNGSSAVTVTNKAVVPVATNNNTSKKTTATAHPSAAPPKKIEEQSSPKKEVVAATAAASADKHNGPEIHVATATTERPVKAGADAQPKKQEEESRDRKEVASSAADAPPKKQEEESPDKKEVVPSTTVECAEDKDDDPVIQVVSAVAVDVKEASGVRPEADQQQDAVMRELNRRKMEAEAKIMEMEVQMKMMELKQKEMAMQQAMQQMMMTNPQQPPPTQVAAAAASSYPSTQQPQPAATLPLQQVAEDPAAKGAAQIVTGYCCEPTDMEEEEEPEEATVDEEQPREVEVIDVSIMMREPSRLVLIASPQASASTSPSVAPPPPPPPPFGRCSTWSSSATGGTNTKRGLRGGGRSPNRMRGDAAFRSSNLM